MVIRFLASNPIFARFWVPDNYLDYASHPSPPHFIFSTHNIRLSSLSINIRATVFSLVCSLRPGLSLPLQINIFILQFKFHPGPSRGQQNFVEIFTRCLLYWQLFLLESNHECFHTRCLLAPKIETHDTWEIFGGFEDLCYNQTNCWWWFFTDKCVNLTWRDHVQTPDSAKIFI